MGRNRKTFTDTFKKEVAIEAIKEKNTVNLEFRSNFPQFRS